MNVSVKQSINPYESMQVTYLIGCPGLSARPVQMVPDVPPLDLQRVRGHPRPSEGARHLHVLTSLSGHVMRHLCEHGWTTQKGVGGGHGKYMMPFRFITNEMVWSTLRSLKIYGKCMDMEITRFR